MCHAQSLFDRGIVDNLAQHYSGGSGCAYDRPFECIPIHARLYRANPWMQQMRQISDRTDAPPRSFVLYSCERVRVPVAGHGEFARPAVLRCYKIMREKRSEGVVERSRSPVWTNDTRFGSVMCIFTGAMCNNRVYRVRTRQVRLGARWTERRLEELGE